jgi:tripeptide aminopeptidase
VRVVGNWYSDNEWDEPVNAYCGARNAPLTILMLTGLDDVTKPALRVDAAGNKNETTR